MRKLLYACGLILVAAVIFLIVGLNQLWHVALAKPKTAEPVAFTIDEGESFQSIARRLESQEVIASAFWFRVAAEFAGSSDEVKSGAHALLPRDNYLSLLGALTASPSGNEIKVTIPEGFTLAQMGSLLNDLDLVTPLEWQAVTGVDSPLEQHAFVVAAQKPADVDLEGYLFPDTYRFAADATAEQIATAMLTTMADRVDRLDTPSGDAAGYTMHQLLTLASIVEREVRQSDTMKNVADIFLKRLEINMPLQADSTVNYVTGGTNPSISLDDRDNTESPYNTYKYPGLPPGPISAPSLNALTAVLHPAENPYFFFLTTDEGEIYYAETYEEHLVNKAAHLD